MYLKSHSYGEYVFDWGWASAYERAGGEYYPKLQVSVPFTPVPGPRLLLHPDAALGREALVQGLIGAAQQLETSSLHVTFCPEDEWRSLGEAGLLLRTGVQYHWHNRGYASFDDFLACLKSSRRKTIRKERARVAQQGLTLEALTGDTITPDIWDVFYPFYLSTVDKRWGNAYLSKRFFRRLGEIMPERVVLIMARHEGRYVAGALNLRGADTLYGRVWGARQASSSSSISRPATTPRSSSRSSMAWRGSRRAPRGSTSCNAATSPRPPTAPTGFAIQASDAPSPIFCSKSGSKWRRKSNNCARSYLIGRNNLLEIVVRKIFEQDIDDQNGRTAEHQDQIEHRLRPGQPQCQRRGQGDQSADGDAGIAQLRQHRERHQRPVSWFPDR